VKYKLNSDVLFRRNSVFKGLTHNLHEACREGGTYPSPPMKSFGKYRKRRKYTKY
jgi:hypothetical protein